MVNGRLPCRRCWPPRGGRLKPIDNLTCTESCLPERALSQILLKSLLFKFSKKTRSILLEYGQKSVLHANRPFKAPSYSRFRCGRTSRGETGLGHAVPFADGVLAGRRAGIAAERRIPACTESSGQRQRGGVGGQSDRHRHGPVLRAAGGSVLGRIAGSGRDRIPGAGRRKNALRISQRATGTERDRRGERSEREQARSARGETLAEYFDSGRSRAGLARTAAPPGGAQPTSGIGQFPDLPRILGPWRAHNPMDDLTVGRRVFSFDDRIHQAVLPPYIERMPATRAAGTTEAMTIDEVIDNFSLLDEWDDRYRYVIELGRGLKPLDDSDAHIVRGLIAILFAIYSGRSARDILTTDAITLFDRIGLREHLTPQRSNGFRSMVERIKSDARAALADASMSFPRKAGTTRT